MENCNCHTEIILKGSGQLERYLEALDPSYVSIDGRSFEDLLSFAAAYANQIRFYDMPGDEVNDTTPPAKVSWVEFFKRDMAVIAASVASVNLDKIRNDYENISEQILLDPSAELYADLLNQIVAIAAQIDQWYSAAIPQNPLHADIDLAVKSSLSAQLKKLIAYEEGFIVVDSKTVLNIDFSKLQNKDEWGLNAAVNPEFDIYLGTTPEARILNAVPYVDDIFQAFFGVINNIVDDAPGYLSFAITQYPAHQPYMALYIAFLQLFALAQEQMNGLTGRMLDFYYRDVLRLAPKSAVPDKVFVIFQLAQNVAEYDLPQGTSLSAGKDAAGLDQVYRTEADFVINQASVKELKNIFIQKTPVTADEAGKTVAAVYANPVANSMDGLGVKFTVPNSKWPTFGSGGAVQTAPKNICEYISQKQAALTPPNNTQIGFAIASPQLVLQGGTRLIKCSMPFDFSKFPVNVNMLKTLNLQVVLTGEKSWLNISRLMDKKEAEAIKQVMDNGLFPAPDPTNGFLSESGFFFAQEEDTNSKPVTGILYIFMPISEQGIVPFNAKTHTGNYQTAYPVMQVLIGSGLGFPASFFHGLKVDSLSIAVQVGSINGIKNKGQDINNDGLKKVNIQTDSGLVTPGKPFDPFTKVPYQGMSFYIESDEVFNKPMGQLAVNITKSIPEEPDSNYSFPYAVSVLARNNWKGLVDHYGQQFTTESLTFNILNVANKSDAGQFVQFTQVIDEAATTPDHFPISLDRSPIEYYTGYDIGAYKNFIRIDNQANFDDDIQSLIRDAPKFQIQGLSLSYQSVLTVLDPKIDQFFHIYPFGTVETYITTPGTETVNKQLILQQKPLMLDAKNILLPQFTFLNPTEVYKDVVSGKGSKIRTELFIKSAQYSGDEVLDKLIYDASGLNRIIRGGNNQYSDTVQEEGLLFIGVEKLQPLQTLSLLFEFAPGSAIDEDGDLDEIKINWSYLIYNEWRPLNAENIISDSTYRFQTTGIVKLSVPADANDSHTIITNGLYWFCASVTNKSERIPELIDIIAQAAEVVFYDQGNSPSHYDNALPAGSISKLSVAVSQVKGVTQPYASFDGKHKEEGKEYYTRVSERLRHKRRAVTPWDYERLVLEQFPEVFKVKCITNVDPECLCPDPPSLLEARDAGLLTKPKCCGPVKSSGNVLIVPVPNLKNNNAENPLQPKTSRLTLIEIVNYLTPLTSPFVTVHAKNPVYEQVIVFFRVKFLSGIDKGYHLQKLNEEIVQYLTPWAFNAEIEADFGKKIYASSIINFIQQRSYVDFITDFLMGVCRDECCVPDTPDTTTVTAENFVTALNQVSGCNDIEAFLKNQGYFIGDVIAEPSTQRSLLVSAPKHIILLYEDPKELTVCEKLQKVVPLPIHFPTSVVEAPAEQSPTPPPAPAPFAAPEEAAAAPATEEVKPEATNLENNLSAGEVKELAPQEAAVAVEKHNVIEETIENFDKALGAQTRNITEKGKAAVKKAEDFIKNVVKGKSSGPSQIDPAPETKELPPADDKSSNSNKSK
ncbi:hypothetical protein [Mucilaginibacter ginsenosidivorax]|uniref:Baseplate protein J-like domain-containing protein n=1 Tax=Mucilaginibacter ginsenosidivorax TaxID=862126 RepID=A0A5B8W6W5_9SPHI|nr:hypothetical protein [Mucilaginibacter ginsenosidivorax]QEC77998.1 hypothetical protein FSB76_19405 [Mucilaginibacter ginsenosidivorax]